MRTIKDQLDAAINSGITPEEAERQKQLVASNNSYESFFEPNYSPLNPMIGESVTQALRDGIAKTPDFESSGLARMMGNAHDTFNQRSSEPPPTPNAPSAEPRRQVAGAAPASEPAVAPQGPSVRDILMRQMLPPDLSRDELKDAQKTSNNLRTDALLGHGAATIGAALSRGDKVKPNEEFYKELLSQSDNPVKNILQQRQAVADQLKQRASVNQLAEMESGSDPNSVESKALREFYRKSPATANVAKQIPNFDFLSANDIKEHFSKPTELMVRSEDNRLKAEQNGLYKQAMLQNKVDSRDNMAHQRNLRALKGDTNLRQRLQQYQNLENNLKLLEHPENMTPEQFQETQMAVRSNLGIKGTSGIDERAKTQYKGLGLNAAALEELLFTKPVTLDPNHPYIKHIKNLATQEQANIRSQYSNGLKAVTAGNNSVYSRHPELQQDLEDAVGAFQNQLTSGGKQASPEDQQAIQWAQSHPEDPRAQQILKMHGM